ncbi:MAG: PEP-CTERM sorting domain-containing protein [Planctomycetia bacterium]|nr:PEP-CTERM sorting domain-containing protein [Planctomycetia bacterium]
MDTNTETSIYIGDDSFGSLTITGNSNYTGKITVGLVNGFVAYQGETPIADAVFYNNTGTTDGNEIITASNLFSVTDTSSITLANDKNFGTYAIDGSAVTFKEGSQTGYLNINGIDGKYELKLFVDGIKDMVDFETWLNSDSTDITARVENENEVSFTGFDLGNFTFLYDFTGYENAVVSATGLSGASLPEPTTWVLLALGVGMLVLRKKN